MITNNYLKLSERVTRSDGRNTHRVFAFHFFDDTVDKECARIAELAYGFVEYSPKFRTACIFREGRGGTALAMFPCVVWR